MLPLCPTHETSIMLGLLLITEIELPLAMVDAVLSSALVQPCRGCVYCGTGLATVEGVNMYRSFCSNAARRDLIPLSKKEELLVTSRDPSRWRLSVCERSSRMLCPWRVPRDIEIFSRCGNLLLLLRSDEAALAYVLHAALLRPGSSTYETTHSTPDP
jgi:hypothetical protein